MQRLGLKCSGVLQVGASFGQEVEAIASSGASVAVLVEALQQPYAALAEKIRGRPGLIAVRCLCSDTTGTTVRFKVATNKGMSSSILEPASHLDIVPSVRFPREIELQTVTVDDLFADLTRTSGRSFAMINTMMLDVQGAEHLVLRGASRTLKHVEHIYSEVSLGGLYKGDMPLEAFQQFMSERGFQMIWMELGRYGWGDALFTRRTSFAAASFNGQGS
jgi:FkbM family methyltransferase